MTEKTAEERAIAYIVAGGFPKEEWAKANKIYGCPSNADDNVKKTKATSYNEMLDVFTKCHDLGLNSVVCEDGSAAVAISGFWNKKQGKLVKVIYATVPALLQRAHAKGLACYSYVYPPAGVGEYTTIERTKYGGDLIRIKSFAWISIEFYRVVKGVQVGPSTSERVLLEDAVPASAGMVWEQHASKMHANAALRRAVIRMFHLNASEMEGMETIGSGSGSTASRLAEDLNYDKDEEEASATPAPQAKPKRAARAKTTAKVKAKPPQTAANALDGEEDDDEAVAEPVSAASALDGNDNNDDDEDSPWNPDDDDTPGDE